MTTYLLLNIVFLATIIFFLPSKATRIKNAFWVTLGALILLTALFDPIIIALDIVDYDPSKLLGVYWFGAPIEDFFYALYAAIIVPLIWHKIGDKRHA